MLAERGPAAASAWHTLFGQITSTLEVPFDAGEGDGVEPHTIDRLLAHVRNPDRDLRKHALEALYDGLEPAPGHARARLRHAGRPTASRWTGCAATRARWTRRTCATSCPAGVVEGMMDAVERHYPLAHRWFRVKAGILGLDRLELHDQYAPIGEARAVDYPEATRLIDDVVRPLLAARRGDRRRVLRGAPHRRRAAVAASAAAPSAPRSRRTPRRTSS